MTRIAVLGASGFIGSAVVEAARHGGHTVVPLRAPRLAFGADHTGATRRLSVQVTGVDVVVNCAGNPDASANNVHELQVVNSVLPGVIGAAARNAGVLRYIHVSSAVVQGRRETLDSSDATDAFSAYASSKIGGEVAARAEGPEATTVYRPPSVHAPTRRVTRQLAKIASSPLSTVAAPGNRPTPQTHILDVADAILMLCSSTTPPPSVVHHPWQGHTTGGLLRVLGAGRSPRLVPTSIGRLVLRAAAAAALLAPRVAPYARRVEMIWFGQAQGPSWLTEQGWRPVTTDEDWTHLAQQARQQRPYTTMKVQR